MARYPIWFPGEVELRWSTGLRQRIDRGNFADWSPETGLTILIGRTRSEHYLLCTDELIYIAGAAGAVEWDTAVGSHNLFAHLG